MVGAVDSYLWFYFLLNILRRHFAEEIPLKILITAFAALAVMTAANAEPSNSTPHARACMKKYGFTYEQWRAYQVPAEKAEPYRRCRDGRAGSR
jgi:hypothetical protein